MAVTLYQFPAAFGLPNASPFCMKVETYLRMAGIDYATRYGMYQLRAPKKKLPYIDDGGRIVADSHLIIDYLKSAYGDPLDATLTPAQRALGTVILRLLEDSLYWVLLYARWIAEPGWSMTRPAFFGKLPLPLRWFVPLLARRSLRQQLHAQGIGRHQPAEIYAIGSADIAALSQLLGEQPFFLGAEPSSIDAAAYAFLANILDVPLDMPLRQAALSHANLPAYCSRMRARYYA
ncbi:MAG: glutathione S-transferase family protein [Betaproteobacteria bacterium]|nr:MAG: glutathione S-transferase family protein [Betaproteobacteria bacterium]